ncbi:MAG: RidA family protein [Gemmatimonadetes bacterium]|nr:RidA family protein [Gemmatimonadota bacterium]MCY3943020.1 RidA family protein [Gemmatimonadota bacterium]
MPQIAVVQTDRAPAAIGPYSQAVIAGGWIFSSGQIPIDPATGAIPGGTVEEQTEQALGNLAAVLEAAGGGLGTVVRTTVYLSDMAFFGDMNAVYARHFGDHRPARSTVAVAALPKGVDVEIDATAMVAREAP